MSDLRDVLGPCPFCGSEASLVREADFVTVACPHYYCNFSQIPLRDEKKAVDRWNTRAALAQPEAVEPVAWVELSANTAWIDGRDVVLLVRGMEVSARYCAGEWSDETPNSPREYSGAVWACFDDEFQLEIEDWSKDPSEWGHAGATHWRTTATPPLAPDERMRRALERSAQGWANVIELDLLPKQHRETAEALRDEARSALSRADEGKESEGGPLNWQLSEDAKARIAEIDSNRRNAALNACNIVAGSPSDPTPPDATAQREEIARNIEMAWAIEPTPFNRADVAARVAIYFLQTRAGG